MRLIRYKDRLVSKESKDSQLTNPLNLVDKRGSGVNLLCGDPACAPHQANTFLLVYFSKKKKEKGFPDAVAIAGPVAGRDATWASLPGISVDLPCSRVTELYGYIYQGQPQPVGDVKRSGIIF